MNQSDKNRSLLDRMESIPRNAMSYRQSIDTLLAPAQNWRACFLDILIAVSGLYADYLFMLKYLPELQTISVRRHTTNVSKSTVVREQELRRTLERKLEVSLHSNGFIPDNPFSTITGLRNLQDYIDHLRLHLPEIYEETFRVEALTTSFLLDQSASALAGLAVGLQHLGRNHIIFVLQALEWLADEGSWSEPSTMGER